MAGGNWANLLVEGQVKTDGVLGRVKVGWVVLISPGVRGSPVLAKEVGWEVPPAEGLATLRALNLLFPEFVEGGAFASGAAFVGSFGVVGGEGVRVDCHHFGFGNVGLEPHSAEQANQDEGGFAEPGHLGGTNKAIVLPEPSIHPL